MMNISLFDPDYDLARLAVDHLVEEAHRGQTRADRITPYVNHVRQVSERASAACISHEENGEHFMEVARIAGLCHDVREDKPDFPLEARLKSISSDAKWLSFIEDVLTVVDLLTNTECTDYLEYLLRMKGSGDGRLIRTTLEVKRADMECNFSEIHLVPSSGARKGLTTKYLLSYYILFGENLAVKMKNEVLSRV